MKVDGHLVLYVHQRRWVDGMSQKAVARLLASTVGRSTVQRIDHGRYDHLTDVEPGDLRAYVHQLPELPVPEGAARCPVCGFRVPSQEGRCPVCAAHAMRAAGEGPWVSPPIPEDVERDDPEIRLEFRSAAARARYEKLRELRRRWQALQDGN